MIITHRQSDKLFDIKISMQVKCLSKCEFEHNVTECPIKMPSDPLIEKMLSIRKPLSKEKI